MENAGARLVDELEERGLLGERATVFSGKGNNGGDGFVAARHMVNRGVGVDIVLVGRPRDITSLEAQENWQIISQLGEGVDFYLVRDSKDVQGLPEFESEVILDSMLGTGVRGELREPIDSVAKFINELDSYTVAVDLPTGLNPRTGETSRNSVKCDLTVTFHDIKSGLEEAGEGQTGEVAVADIGIPNVAERMAGPGDVQMAVSPRSIGSHKGENGRLLMVGGGSRYIGAPALAGLSALKSGADLVTIAAPFETARAINSFSPDLITLKLPGEVLVPEALSEIEDELRKATAVLIGPGLGTEPDAREATLSLMNTIVEDYPQLPVLLDADGLKMVSEEPDILRAANCLITPHAGEFELLPGSGLSEDERDRPDEVSEVAKDLKTPILLKSHVDICADSDGRVVLNDTGNPGMTVGGTGDVLAGITAAFLSQGSDPFRAAAAGSFVCGMAGDLCSQEMGYEFIATDVKDRIPTAISEVREYW